MLNDCRTDMFTPIYILMSFLFHSFKAGLIILQSILLYSNIHFFLLDNEIFLLGSVATIVRCELIVGIDKFPSFMFKHNSNIAFNSSGLAFLTVHSSMILHVEAFLKIQYVFGYEIEVVLSLLQYQLFLSELIAFFLAHQYHQHCLNAD